MKRVLVFLNDSNLLENIREALTLEGYEVIPAYGLKSLALVRSILPDIVFSEIKTEHTRDIQYLSALKSDRVTSFIKFVFIDSGAWPEQKAALRRNGADAFIEQPFSLKEIRKTFNSVLRA
jgi:CheY-like chemotaxis protein